MTLQEYRKKRHFGTTPEPRGRKSAKGGASFVVQKHDATRLHYDFRLEMDGVLKSWAVTRGPSLVAGEKRLAVHVEDHPLEYGGFEGTIPEGEYGGGSVIIWDRGMWRPIGDAHKGYAKGHLDFELDGEKLRGRWHLVKMRAAPREKHENWLLIKGDDEFAQPADAPDVLTAQPQSVKTGRDISELAGEAPGWSSKTGRIDKPRASRKTAGGKTAGGKTADNKTASRAAASDERRRSAPVEASKIKGAKKAALPDFVAPSLAALARQPPSGPRWLHEIKFDGYRLQAHIEAGRVKLLTRGGLDWSHKFGKEISAALAALPVQGALIDGELVAEDGAHATSFSILQADLSEGRADRLAFYAFDLLWLDGYDLRGAVLADRKELLRRLLDGASQTLRYSAHFDEDGARVLQHACRLGLEGIVSKLRDAPYRSGRSGSWVKSKCAARQEFVVAGYVPSTAARQAIGSLALGVYEDGKLRHVGRVGTGYTAAVARQLFHKLSGMRTASTPFANRLTSAEARQLQFVRPELVAEVEFGGWTGDGHVRHASFRGLREDKSPREVVREMTKPLKAKSVPLSKTVTLTHPDRLYWPDEGVTKQGLADYFAEVWPNIAPFIVGRPLALVRCPDGVAGEKFFQKHPWKGVNANLTLVKDPQAPSEPPMLAIKDLDGLTALAQSASLEIHPWGSTIGDLERPDNIIMDLDPGEDVAWEQVIAAAEEVRERLKRAGLAAFVKTSGGKGLHVVAPVKPKAAWPAVKAFTKAIADAMAADAPERYVATIAKAKRHGRILIDYLRNQRGATAVAAYSPRARPGAAVSMPLAWSELGPQIGPAYFTIANAPARLAAAKRDPWADFKAAAAPIEAPGTARRRRT
jgi:bifunctional non-homologous end joining protein LigD